MSEIVNESTENIPETFEEIGTESKQIAEMMPEQMRYKGQRGPDKAPRRFNLNSLRNLKQYQNIPLQTTNDSNKWVWVFVGILVAVLIGIIIWRIYEWWKTKN